MEINSISAGRTALSIALTLCFILSGLYLVPLGSPAAAADDVTGPFALRSTGYPTSQVVDQENPTHDGMFTGVDWSMWISQTFVAGMTGELTSVAVWLDPLTPNRALSVQIWTTDGFDTPMSPIGTPVLIPSVDVSGWLYVGLNEAIPVMVGEGYALVLSSNDFSVCYWLRKNTDTYPGGVSRTSVNQGGSWSAPLAYDFTFRTFIGNLPGTIKNVAWHSSGQFALGVTGTDPIVHRYDRISGTWSPFLNMNVGEVMNDVVFDPQPGWDRFYFVGENTNNMEPLAYEFQYDPVGGSNLYPLLFGGMNGVFHGVERSDNGASPYKFLAVGENRATGRPLMAWYHSSTGWITVTTGLDPGDILMDVTWGRDSNYYAVGTDTSANGVMYILAIGANSAAKTSTIFGAFYAMDWCPDIVSHDYALIVGMNSGGTGNVYTFDRSDIDPVSTTDVIYNDVHWHPDGSMAVLVGEDASNTQGEAAIHYAGSDMVVDCTHLLPTGAPPLFGVAVKGPSSPSSAIITGTGGGIVFYPNALNQDTGIIINAAYPHLYWIGFNTTAGTSRVEQQVPPDDWYQFSLAANYSQGWNNVEVIIEAWHDRGAVGDASVYPAQIDANRCLAFRIHYDPSIPSYTMTYPGGPEFAVGGYTDNNIGGPAGEETHEIRLEVWLGPQTRSGDGNGFISGDSDTGSMKNAALLDANSWDFSVRVQDRNFVTAGQTMFSEFGVNRLVSISAAGNPSGNAPPGASDVPMSVPSHIAYSSNTIYTVSVSIPNVGLNGNPFAVDNIPATDVAVANTNILASQQYTELNSTDCPVGRAFQGADVAWFVWGNSTAAGDPFMPAPCNGTYAFGPWGSNFNNYGNPAGTTQLEWWVTVQATTREGTYWAVITVTIDAA